jgi:hypothetical protein
VVTDVEAGIEEFRELGRGVYLLNDQRPDHEGDGRTVTITVEKVVDRYPLQL